MNGMVCSAFSKFVREKPDKAAPDIFPCAYGRTKAAVKNLPGEPGPTRSS